MNANAAQLDFSLFLFESELAWTHTQGASQRVFAALCKCKKSVSRKATPVT